MDATLKARICARLTSEIDQMPPRLRSAAKYIVDNEHDFGLDPIRVSAKKIGISANSLVRLAQYLEFENFDDLREPFRRSLLEQAEPTQGDTWLRRMAGKGGFAEKQATLAGNEANAVNRSLQRLSPEKAEAAIEIMLKSRDVYVVATRASYALAYFFHYVGRMALPNLQLVPRHMGSPLEEMMDMDHRDALIAITFSPYSMETIRALRHANSLGANVILVSDSELIAPGIKSDVFLHVSTQSSHHFGCYAGAFAVLECLLAHLFRLGGDRAASRVLGYQSLREDIGAYWKEKVPKIRR